MTPKAIETFSTFGSGLLCAALGIIALAVFFTALNRLSSGGAFVARLMFWPVGRLSDRLKQRVTHKLACQVRNRRLHCESSNNSACVLGYKHAAYR